MARIGLLTLLYFLFAWPSLVVQDVQSSQDTVYAGSDSMIFDYHEAWSFEEGFEEGYLSSEEYSYEDLQSEKNWLERAKLWLTGLWDRFLGSIWEGLMLSGFWAVFFQLAPILLILTLMSLLVWLAMKYSVGHSENPKNHFSSLSTDEVLIKSDNLKELVVEAIKNGDFRLALRYRYLLVLQHLIDRKLILWKSSKTNYDYQKELRETTFIAPFTEVTRIYNFVWYGHLDLDATSYGEFEQAFNKLDQLP